MRLTIVITLLASALCAWAETPWTYVDAQDLRVINQGWTGQQRTYQRLPDFLQDSVRSTLWERQQCSAGIAVRFATNSPRVGVKYQLLWDAHMPHMADTGIKGSDLYIWDDNATMDDSPYDRPGAWRHVNTNRPHLKDDSLKICEATYIEKMEPKMREYMIYMPLYDGVEQLWVKVDSGSVITTGDPMLIRADRRVVAYGTSIMQGGCASRTGMASSNILSRELNCEVINLGFSGEGKMDPCMARAMAQIPDVDMYVIDPVPNCTYIMCDSLTYDFVDIIRKAKPEAQIVMVEGPLYPYGRYETYFSDYLPLKNKLYHDNYERLKADNPERLTYVTSEDLDGPEDDGTVDGIHLTDLGFRHYADKLRPVMRQLLP